MTRKYFFRGNYKEITCTCTKFIKFIRRLIVIHVDIKLKYECIVSIHFYFICNEYMVQEDRIGILFLSTFKSTYRTRLNPIAGEGHALPCHILSIYFLQQTPIFAQNNPIIHSSFSLSSILFSNPSVRIRTCTYIYISSPVFFHSQFLTPLFNY